MESIPRICWRDYIYSIWPGNALQSHRRRYKMWLEESMSGLLCWQWDPNQQHKMDKQIFFLFFFCSLASHSQLKKVKGLFKMISHCRNLTQSGWREQDLFCCHLEVRSIFSIDYMYETVVCCSRMIKDFPHITYPFLFLSFSPDTDYRFLLNFKFPPKCVLCGKRSWI